MSDYQFEQLETLSLVRMHLKTLPRGEKEKLRMMAADYLEFRGRVDRFFATYFEDVCNNACYQNRRSACCSREGIITFFADVVLNQLFSDDGEIGLLADALRQENNSLKCVYLGPGGCRWKIKPVVCQMFLCEPAKARVFRDHPAAEGEWAELERERKKFTWPDRPVLFDTLEKYFIAMGCGSPLMYMHQNPGLLRVKKKAGL
jgi:hypothetical protein